MISKATAMATMLPIPDVVCTTLGAAEGPGGPLVKIAPSSNLHPAQTSFSPPATDQSVPLARSSRYCLCSPDKFGGIDFERPSEHPNEVEADVTATSFQRCDVGAIDVSLVSKLLLAEAKLVSVVPDAISEQPLAFGDLDRRLRHEVI